MSSLPRISVVVATLNRAPFLKRMLDHLFQTDYPNLEVIVVDGASQDETVGLLQSYGRKIALWKSEPDPGEYFAYNKGLQLATGEIVKPMTDDDLLHPESFRWAADYFLGHPETDIVFGQVRYRFEEPGKITQVGVTNASDPARLSLRNWLRETQGVFSTAAFIRRGVFERIGYFSTQYSCGDIEFWARAVSRNIKMGLIPQVVVDGCIGPQSGVVKKRRQLAIDMVKISARYGTTADVLANIWRKLIRQFIWGQSAKVAHFFGLHPLQYWHRRHRQPSLQEEKNRLKP
jgi:glycosyltransferase involved in cell wall biosynthesis